MKRSKLGWFTYYHMFSFDSFKWNGGGTQPEAPDTMGIAAREMAVHKETLLKLLGSVGGSFQLTHGTDQRDVNIEVSPDALSVTVTTPRRIARCQLQYVFNGASLPIVRKSSICQQTRNLNCNKLGLCPLVKTEVFDAHTIASLSIILEAVRHVVDTLVFRRLIDRSMTSAERMKSQSSGSGGAKQMCGIPTRNG